MLGQIKNRPALAALMAQARKHAVPDPDLLASCAGLDVKIAKPKLVGKRAASAGLVADFSNEGPVAARTAGGPATANPPATLAAPVS